MRKILITTILLVFGLLVIFYFRGGSLPEPDLKRTAWIRNALASGKPVTIVALGDSITAGVHAPFTYLDRIGERLRSRYPTSRLILKNAGVPGDTAQRGLQRVEQDVVACKPDLVFIEFGWNDLKDGVSREDFEKALSSIVDRIRQSTSAKVFLLTTTQVNVVLANWKIKSRNKIIRRIAEEKDCGLIDVYRYFKVARKQGADLEELMSDDHIHPSAKGQQLIARAVLRELVP